jgi:DNA-binding CsgD family transcriptional regulator
MQEKLTSREQDVYNLLLEGITAKEIASILKLGYRTVDFHRNNIYRKLDVQHVQELIAKYKDNHIKVHDKPEAAFTMKIIDPVYLYPEKWNNTKYRCYGEYWNSFDRIKLPDFYTGKFTDLFPPSPGSWVKFLISGTVDERLKRASFNFFYVLNDVTLSFTDRFIFLAGGMNTKFSDIGPGEFSKVEVEIKREEGIDIEALLESKPGDIHVQFYNTFSWFPYEDSSSNATAFDSGEKIPDDVKEHQVMATVRNLIIEPC